MFEIKNITFNDICQQFTAEFTNGKYMRFPAELVVSSELIMRRTAWPVPSKKQWREAKKNITLLVRSTDA